MAQKTSKSLGRVLEITGLDEDYRNVFLSKKVPYVLFRKGKISEDEFLKEIGRPIEPYIDYIKKREENYGVINNMGRDRIRENIRESLKNLRSNSLSKLYKIVSEFNLFPIETKTDPKTLKEYEEKCTGIIQGAVNI